MKNLVTFLFAFFSFQIFGQNLPPALSNVQVELSGNNILTLHYDLEDAEGDAVTVTLRAAERGGQVFNYDTGNAAGDVGPGIAPGAGKQIVWDFSAYATAMPDFRLMLVADDLQPVDIQTIVDQVDSTNLLGDLTSIEGIRHRTAGAAHLEETKNLIHNRCLENRLETYRQEFPYGNYNAANIIGRHIGTENEAATLILGGHFDSEPNTPGADDNGSAIAGMLEAVRILSKYGCKKSIKFIGFDLEEVGLVGSARYVEQGILPGEIIEGMMAFEMIGYYSEAPNTQTLPNGFNLLFTGAYNQVAADEFRGNFITNVGQINGASLIADFENAAAAYVPDLRVVSVEAPATWQSLTPDLGRSDHAPFWVAGIPALMLTDGANFRNPNYHTPNDTIGSLNFTFMQQVTKAAVATLAQLADIQHATTWWTDTEFFISTTSEPATCDFTVSPNPTGKNLQLTWQGCSPGGRLQTALTGMQGELVFEKTFEAGETGRVFQLDLEGIASGVYFLTVKNNRGAWTRKVVLN